MQYNDKKINRLMFKLVFWALVAIVVFVSVHVVSVFKKRQEVEAEIEKINQEKTALNDKKEELNNLLDYFQDKSFIEKEARRKLNMQKEGERAVIVINKGENSDLSANISEAEDASHQKRPEDLSNYHKWLDFIFK